jgi:sulfonate transport system substrate-binding protein
MTYQRTTRRSILAAAALLPLAACSRERQESAAGRKRVRLTYGLISVPKARGVFEQTLREQGIDVEWLGPFPNHAPTLQAVATGSADFSFGGSSTPAAQAILSGSRLVYVAWSVTTPRTTSIITLPSSKINSIPELVGKTVAVNKAGVAEFLLVAALEKYAVPRERVKVVYLNPPDAAPAFASGQIDAWAIWTGPLEMAEVSYGAKRIFEEGKELDYQIDFGTYLVREEYAHSEPDTIRAVVRAYQAEAAWAAAHHAEAQAYGYKLSKYPAAVVARLDSHPVTTTWNFIDPRGISELQRGADWLSKRGVLSGHLDVAAHAVSL